jgi:hypothetical protein
MDKIWVTEECFERRDDGKRYGLYQSKPYETFTSNRKKLFNALQREFGPCKGSLYIEYPDGSSQRVGWHFEKRVKYTDSDKSFNQETLVTIVTPDLHEVMVKQKHHIPVNLDTLSPVNI